MVNQTYDYNTLKQKFLSYLFMYRKEIEAPKRITSRIEKFFGLSSPTFNCAMYELKGQGLVIDTRIGNSKVWSLTVKGILAIEKSKN